MTDILDTIDGALDGWTSSDAMRWTPNPEPALLPVAIQYFGLDEITGQVEFSVSLDAKWLRIVFGAVGKPGRRVIRAVEARVRATAALERLRAYDPSRSAMRAAYRHKTRGRRR